MSPIDKVFISIISGLYADLEGLPWGVDNSYRYSFKNKRAGPRVPMQSYPSDQNMTWSILGHSLHSPVFLCGRIYTNENWYQTLCYPYGSRVHSHHILRRAEVTFKV